MCCNERLKASGVNDSLYTKSRLRKGISGLPEGNAGIPGFQNIL